MCYNYKTEYADIPYQMTVGGAFVYVCENPGGRFNDFDQFEQRLRVYNAVRYNVDFSRGP